MLAKTLVVFYVWSPDIFVLIFIITLFQALFILLCQIKHYHTIPYVTYVDRSVDGKTEVRGDSHQYRMFLSHFTVTYACHAVP